jgi:hypothetical protein
MCECTLYEPDPGLSYSNSYCEDCRSNWFSYFEARR